MINLKIDSHILERHRTFLKESSLCQNIQKLFEKKSLSILEEKFGEIFVKQHSEFCQCLCEEYQNMHEGKNKNIFVGTPAYLHIFIQKVNHKYGAIQQKIETNQEYAHYIYQVFGYDQFVDSYGLIKKSVRTKKDVEYITLENFDSTEENFKWGAYCKTPHKM